MSILSCRTAIGFGFVNDDARLLMDLPGTVSRHFRPFTFEDEASFSPWIADLVPMTHINHPMMPLVYDAIEGRHFMSSTADGGGGGGQTREERIQVAMGRVVPAGNRGGGGSNGGPGIGGGDRRSEATSSVSAEGDQVPMPLNGSEDGGRSDGGSDDVKSLLLETPEVTKKSAKKKMKKKKKITQ
jgi:hypothetical protein